MEHVKIRKRPSQARSREKVQKVLDAAAKLLIEQGIDSVTTPRIAEVSGVTVGSIYQYFPNKESILHELYQWWLDGALEAYATYSDAHQDVNCIKTYFAGLFRHYMVGKSENEHRLSVELGTALRANKDLRQLDNLHDRRLGKAVRQDLVRLGVLPNAGKVSKVRSSRLAFFSATFLALMDMVSGSKPAQRSAFIDYAAEVIEGAALNI